VGYLTWGPTGYQRPERRDDGRRTFRLLPGEPLPTRYGPDLYRQIFTAGPKAAAAGSPAVAIDL
jgi:hypothetical protein